MKKLSIEYVLIGLMAGIAIGFGYAKIREPQPQPDPEQQQIVEKLRQDYNLALDRLSHHVQLGLDLELDEAPCRRDLVVGYAKTTKTIYGW